MPALVGTSWKMNLTVAQADHWFTTFRPLAGDAAIDFFVLPPFTVLWLARERLAGSGIAWGAQDVSPFADGAHTGDVSAAMLADLGCRYVEVGHAERRRDHGETPATIAAKVNAVIQAGMDVVLCTGELEEGSLEAAIDAVLADIERCLERVGPSDLARVVIAYEPIWAIGEGRRPAPPDRVGRIHRAIAARLGQGAGVRPRIIYGGSVDATSAPVLLAEPGVDGLFIGRNGLDPLRFAEIAGVLPARAGDR
ncbi:MAG TPA: triose-phosphate isomerase family protein [Candidatus Limnocylindrales bacterium]|nr:triose-phosphate isomerase family protein [Candidatus Limnocylindrales bacterium]